MKARAFVETEVEVEISAADAIAAILELPDPAEHIFEANQVLNRLYAIAKRIPDELIEKMTDKARAVIADGLAEQAARYRKAMLAATSTSATAVSPVKATQQMVDAINALPDWSGFTVNDLQALLDAIATAASTGSEIK